MTTTFMDSNAGYRLRRTTRTGLKLIGLIVLSFWSLSPIVWVFSTSIKTKVEAFALPPKVFFHPTLEHYRILFDQYGFQTLLRNSTIVAGGSTLIAITLGTLAAYSLSRMVFKRNNDVQFWILSMRMLPPVTVLLPFFILWSNLGMLATFVPLIAMHVLMNLPMAIWIMKSFFDDLPIETEEAALIDGCTPFGVFRHVSLRLASPGIVATSALLLLQSWNEFLFALILTSKATRTASVSLAQFITTSGTKWGEITAASTLVMLPPLIFIIFMQRYLVRGLTAGAVK
ncbi:carbohydrate ABC transporter permease [Aggregatilinea lenta]|uniref:carbohydrate ABC transporter permease n=1 Tax=Aggregatilinea lenta TaxID=913108 RepID=UPI000E5B5FAF|nr:carbohydrate ABC transporter permease [Aggregatilinea lenta]